MADVGTYETTNLAEATSYHRDLYHSERGALYSPGVSTLIVDGESISAADYLDHQRLRSVWARHPARHRDRAGRGGPVLDRRPAAARGGVRWPPPATARTSRWRRSPCRSSTPARRARRRRSTRSVPARAWGWRRNRPSGSTSRATRARLCAATGLAIGSLAAAWLLRRRTRGSSDEVADDADDP